MTQHKIKPNSNNNFNSNNVQFLKVFFIRIINEKYETHRKQNSDSFSFSFDETILSENNEWGKWEIYLFCYTRIKENERIAREKKKLSMIKNVRNKKIFFFRMLVFMEPESPCNLHEEDWWITRSFIVCEKCVLGNFQMFISIFYLFFFKSI